MTAKEELRISKNFLHCNVFDSFLFLLMGLPLLIKIIFRTKIFVRLKLGFSPSAEDIDFWSWRPGFPVKFTLTPWNSPFLEIYPFFFSSFFSGKANYSLDKFSFKDHKISQWFFSDITDRWIFRLFVVELLKIFLIPIYFLVVESNTQCWGKLC